MAFAGTTQKCMACEKTVYLVDRLTADNRIYHKACFRCHHCRGTPKIVKPEKTTDHSEINVWGAIKPLIRLKRSRLMELHTIRARFKCTYGGCTISPSNYIAHEGKLYCKHHHIQLFKEKGNYSQLESDNEKDSVSGIQVAAES
uniref:LIM zinc-binding domain-containing protein n=1 Tax=Vitis vinifera TaxID=29760 RepID=A5B599_VITVI|nr:hypothetical protein VITISV_013874 [Vitis vinifera]